MTTEEFNLLTSPWKGKLTKIAQKLGKSKDQMKKYRNGTCKIPDDVASAVRELGLPPEPQLPPPKMTVAEFRDISKKWSAGVLSKLLNIPKGTLDSYRCSDRYKTVSRLAEERIRILVAKDSAGECVEDLFKESTVGKVRLRLANGGVFISPEKERADRRNAYWNRLYAERRKENEK